MPSIIKCLSLSDTNDITEAVGALLIICALVFKALELELIGFHEKDLPFFMVAISCSPKLSNDQDAGSTVKV